MQVTVPDTGSLNRVYDIVSVNERRPFAASALDIDTRAALEFLQVDRVVLSVTSLPTIAQCPDDVVRTENRNGYADAECQTEVTVCSASELQRVKAQLRSVKQQLQSCVLMFDEMSVRKSLHVRESDMALLGKVDLAEHTKPTDQVKDGDHVLVFLFRPFLGGWSQTVGAFCTSGAAPGSTVAKLILQCIVLLSNAGVIVEAVTCDNSTSNRSALNSLGKYLQSLFIFKLPGDKEVQHSHFEALLDYEEQQAGLRAVPKLTKAHISPNAFQKLSVRLAVQIDTLAVLFDDILLEPAECMQDMIHPESTRDCILDYLGGFEVSVRRHPQGGSIARTILSKHKSLAYAIVLVWVLAHSKAEGFAFADHHARQLPIRPEDEPATIFRDELLRHYLGDRDANRNDELALLAPPDACVAAATTAAPRRDAGATQLHLTRPR
ncbi:hypothetical protein HPB51_011547 [Rhipicephalus microplus]|uniref:Transposable element P transposase-like RNase H domain-containing protein n=1 Tax=Rhipicephalus microplus TaxID=6941 RepID=A0A9J6DLZ3_RHIMP|nr:hypothetical protein HPB51_011547 [Rhipicephalus microplus]